MGNNPVKNIDTNGKQSDPYIDAILAKHGYVRSSEILFPAKSNLEKSVRVISFTFDLLASGGSKGVETLFVISNEALNIFNDYETNLPNSTLINLNNYKAVLGRISSEIRKEVLILDGKITELRKANETNGFHSTQIKKYTELKWELEFELEVLNLNLNDVDEAIKNNTIEINEAGSN